MLIFAQKKNTQKKYLPTLSLIFSRGKNELAVAWCRIKLWNIHMRADSYSETISVCPQVTTYKCYLRNIPSKSCQWAPTDFFSVLTTEWQEVQSDKRTSQSLRAGTQVDVMSYVTVEGGKRNAIATYMIILYFSFWMILPRLSPVLLSWCSEVSMFLKKKKFTEV